MVVSKYQKRISGPLLDRIDIHVEVPRVEYEKLSESRLGESSATVRARSKLHDKDKGNDLAMMVRADHKGGRRPPYMQRGYAAGGGAQVLRAR